MVERKLLTNLTAKTCPPILCTPVQMFYSIGMSTAAPDLSKHKNLRILVVDDSAAIRSIVVSSLRELGLRNTLEASDGSIAWEILLKKHIDLILSDVEMPLMDGLELLKRVRATKALYITPFILVTSVNDKETIIKAAKLGVSAYLVKPFEAKVLEVKLHQALRRLKKLKK